MLPSTLCRLEGVRVFNATFNNISVMSWRSVLVVDSYVVEVSFSGRGIRFTGENNRPVTFIT